MSIKFSIINSPEDFYNLKDEWDRLYYSVPRCTPFQSFIWNFTWWQIFGNINLQLLTWWKDLHLVAVAPLFHYNKNGKECLTFIGSGISDYIDILSTEEMLQHCCSDLVEFALSKKRWIEFEFIDIPADSNLMQGIENFKAPFKKEIFNTCTYLDFSKKGINSLPLKLKKNIRHSINLVGLENIKIYKSSSETFNEGFYELVKIHTLHWETKQQHGVLNDPKINKFHSSVGLSLSEKKESFLFNLKIHNTSSVLYYVFGKENKLFVYLNGIHPEFEHYSPGTLGLFFLIKNALNSGYTYIDFLRGKEEYKAHWGVMEKSNYRLIHS